MVGPVAADLFDEGVDDRTAPAGVLTAHEHPVLRDRVWWARSHFLLGYCRLVLAVHESGVQVRQLRDRIREGLPELTAVHDSGSAVELTQQSLSPFQRKYHNLVGIWMGGMKTGSLVVLCRQWGLEKDGVDMIEIDGSCLAPAGGMV